MLLQHEQRFYYQHPNANKAQMNAYRKLDTLRLNFSRKVHDSRVLSHIPLATPDLNLLYLQSSWKDNDIVYCHLLIKNLVSFSVRQSFDGPASRWILSPCFSLDDAFKLST